jgi:demethylmenaquinone methyltransferase/2-methoxy-6-polyprenyl-1,4-benzoquinol methylase
MPLFDHFSFIAPIYERAIPLRDVNKIIRFLELPVQGALLDAGGGTGRVAKAIMDYAGRVFVSDLSIGMLRQASGSNGLHLTCAHTEYLPYPDGIFERVIMVDALHHVCNHEETASEMWRVLKKGGKIIVLEPDVRQFSVKLVALAEKIALMRSHFIPPEQISRLFDYPNARRKIEQDGFNSWIAVEKT